MPGPLSADALKAYADPAYLSRSAPATDETRGANWMHRLGLPALLAGQGADTATTLAALQRGLSEANPVYGEQPSAWRVAGTKAATMLPLALLADRIYDKAKPGSKDRAIALALALAGGSVGAWAAQHNVREMRK